MISIRKTTLSAVAVMLVIGSLVFANGQQDAGGATYPDKPIKVIVPAGAGGGTDVNARLTNKYLREILGVELVVSNIKGAGGTIGSSEVFDADPDGYTMLFHHEGSLMNKMLEVADYGPTDFEVAGIPIVCDTMAIIGSSKYASLEDLISAAKARPGEIEFALELGGTSHMIAAAIEEAAGIKFKYADVGGQSDKIAALMGGHIDVMFSIYGGVADYVKKGDFVCLGVLSEERSDLLPDVPTFMEQGVDISFDKFWFYAFPPETPIEIVDTFASALQTVVNNKEYQAEVRGFFNIPKYFGSTDAESYMDKVYAKTSKYKSALMD